MYGVASAPAIFQKIMDTILKDISCCGCLLDDIIVTGRNDEEHMRNLVEVLERLSKYNIRLKLKKCAFMQDRVEYFGHAIDASGVHMTRDKIEAILKAPRPTNVSELRSLIGMISYYGRFLKNLSTHLEPLHALLRKNKKFKWE